MTTKRVVIFPRRKEDQHQWTRGIVQECTKPKCGWKRRVRARPDGLASSTYEYAHTSNGSQWRTMRHAPECGSEP